jgi:hypothetical protein
MTTPANAIKDEVRLLIDFQIETLKRRAAITSSQLDEYRRRAEQIRMLYAELDRIGTKSVVERQLEKSS